MDTTKGTIHIGEYLRIEDRRRMRTEKLPIGYYAHHLGAIFPCNNPAHVLPISKIKVGN